MKKSLENQNRLKTHSAVEFLGLWETINNPDCNRVEFDALTKNWRANQ